MIRIPVLNDRWHLGRSTLQDTWRSGELPAYRYSGRRTTVVNGADAVEFMDRHWPEFAFGVPEPNYAGRLWQRLSLTDRCAFLLQLRRPADVAMALNVAVPEVGRFIRAGVLRARMRPARRGGSGPSYVVVAADIIHFLDHAAPMFSEASDDEEVASLRRMPNEVNSTRCSSSSAASS